MHLIELDRITKTYTIGGQTVRALDGVSIAIDDGEFTAIMGPSGSGKSTLLHVLGCLDRPDAGRYLLDGEDVAGVSDEALSSVRNRRIGFVFQSFHLMPRLTALENVMLPLRYSDVPMEEGRQRAADLLARVNLDDRAHHRPNEMSGGQRQRVAIARSLVNEPDLLLADEPTGNLDSKTTVEILELLTELNDNGQTVVLVTHEDEVARTTKRIIRMRDGQVLEDTAHAA